jgi:hypothetical protein
MRNENRPLTLPLVILGVGFARFLAATDWLFESSPSISPALRFFPFFLSAIPRLGVEFLTLSSTGSEETYRHQRQWKHYHHDYRLKYSPQKTLWVLEKMV